MQENEKNIMQYKQNPLTGDWLCWIPETSIAYYLKSKHQATIFCEKVNRAFAKGELILEHKDGKIVVKEMNSVVEN